MSVHPAMQFHYNPLDARPNSIRILRIQPGADDDEVSCTLQNTTIDAEPYYALSYMWGPEGDECRVYINGRCRFIRRNLWLFLRKARRTYPNQKFWIDAVCIDQQNIPERNQQVRVMGKLYRHAEKVIVWLGQDAALGTQGISRLFEVMNETDMSRMPEKPDEIPALRDAIMAVFNFAYWSRMWIVQEVSIAKNIVLIYQDSSVEWGIFWATLRDGGMFEYLRDEERQATTATFLQSHLRTRVRCWHPDKIYKVDIAILLARYARSQCSDRKDRIFGLLSLVEGGDDFPVDYADSPHEVAVKAYKLLSRPNYPFAFRLIDVLELNNGRGFLDTIWQGHLARLLPAFKAGECEAGLLYMAVRVRFLFKPCCADCVLGAGHCPTRREPRESPILITCFIPRSPSIHGFSKIEIQETQPDTQPLILGAQQVFKTGSQAFHNIVSVLLSCHEADLTSDNDYLCLEAEMSPHLLEYLHDYISRCVTRANWTQAQLLQAVHKHLHIELTLFRNDANGQGYNAQGHLEHSQLPTQWTLWKAGFDIPPDYQAQHRDRDVAVVPSNGYLPLSHFKDLTIPEESFTAEDHQVVERFRRIKS